MNPAGFVLLGAYVLGALVAIRPLAGHFAWEHGDTRVICDDDRHYQLQVVAPDWFEGWSSAAFCVLMWPALALLVPAFVGLRALVRRSSAHDPWLMLPSERRGRLRAAQARIAELERELLDKEES